MDPPPPGRFTAGKPPGVVLNTEPALGTVCGMQTPVKVSTSSPAGHWASGTESLGAAKTATAGATATATANPPARISRFESSRAAIVTLSVVIDHVVGWILWKLKEICIGSGSSLAIRPLRLRIGPWLWAGADGRPGHRLRPPGPRRSPLARCTPPNH